MAVSQSAAINICDQESPNSDSPDLSGSNQLDQIANDLSQVSLISVTSSEVYVSRHRLSQSSEQYQQSTSTSTSRKIAQPTLKPLMAPLDQLNTISDIEACLDNDLHQLNVLNNIEERWKAISENFETVLYHLNKCGLEVSQASVACLQSLSDAVDLTCNKVDDEMRALYHLMTKCDELTTKLSVAGTFREEIKTLRKSVETLEHLYKSRPKVAQ